LAPSCVHESVYRTEQEYNCPPNNISKHPVDQKDYSLASSVSVPTISDMLSEIKASRTKRRYLLHQKPFSQTVPHLKHKRTTEEIFVSLA
jgi:hypothetical protein